MPDSQRNEPDARERLRRNIGETWDHTAKVLENLRAFLFHSEHFESTHKVKIESVDVGKSELSDLPLLTFIHDVYKICSSPQHEMLGAECLENPATAKLVKFHSIFGVLFTGEASWLFLGELAQFVLGLDRKDKPAFLNKLVILTIVDVASYGYLNQARVDAYQSYAKLLGGLADAGDFEKRAREDTASRLCRLMQANNRVSVNAEAMQACLDDYGEAQELQDRLLLAQFHFGAYSFEPLLRGLLGVAEEYMIDDKTQLSVSRAARAVVHCFFDSLLDTLKGNNPQVVVSKRLVAERELWVYNMEAVAIKQNRNLATFCEWMNRFKSKAERHQLS